MSTRRDYAAQLVSRARQARKLTLREMAEQTQLTMQTLHRFELSKSAPARKTQQRLEDFFGWERGLLANILESDTPWNVADIEKLTGGLPEAQLSDQALLWEVSQRLQSKDQQIQELQDRISELEAELDQREP